MHPAARPLPVSPKAFRHFAAITVAITVCVALFADGESREALSAGIEARQDRNALLKTEADKLGTRHFAARQLHLRDSKRSYLAFAPDDPENAENFGTPMDGSDTDFTGGGRRAPPPPPPGMGPGAVPPGLPATVAKQVVQRPPPRPSEDQIQSLIAASRQRSGAPDTAD